MALISCPECGKEISDKASSCPNCGYKLQEDCKIKVTAKVPLVASIIYMMCVIIYANAYLWNTSSLMMFIIGLALIGVTILDKKLENIIQNYLFVVIYIIGAFILIFDYNISRLDLDFINGNFFSSYIYSGSLGGFLAIFQIVSVSSIILLCISIFFPKISKKYASIALLVSGIIGMVFQIYDKIYLENKWGTTLYGTFYIWLGITIFCFFIIGIAYLLADKKIR